MSVHFYSFATAFCRMSMSVLSHFIRRRSSVTVSQRISRKQGHACMGQEVTNRTKRRAAERRAEFIPGRIDTDLCTDITSRMVELSRRPTACVEHYIGLCCISNWNLAPADESFWTQ